MKIIKLIILKIFLLFFLNSVALASNNFKIITKVGQEIITSYELENKIKITLFLAGEELNQSNINELKRLSLDSLIKNKLKKEEIKKYNYKKNNEQRMFSYLSNLAKRFNVDTADLKNLFKSNGLEFDLFLDEIKIEFLWQSLVYEIYAKKIKLDEKEITKELNQMILSQKSIEEYNLSEIETKILKKNELKDLIKYIQDFDFNKAAQKYSISSSSLNGGNIGWINSQSLSSNILELLRNINVGEYTKPIKRNDYFYILS